eukprot:m.179229 g.179229  ORF g.179229 m.179229 type:complete len:1661 (+) comp25383_c0_seq3:120-5102(+)
MSEQALYDRLKKYREEQVQKLCDVYKEDLSAWFSDMFGRSIAPNNLMEVLRDGTILCQLVKKIEAGEAKWRYETNHPAPVLPPIKINKHSGQYHYLDNAGQFIRWTKAYGVEEAVIFNSTDLVKRENEKQVLYCLMELARCQNGVEPPQLVSLERHLQAIDDGQTSVSVEELDNLQATIEKVVEETGHKKIIAQKRDALGRYYFGQDTAVHVRKFREKMLVRYGDEWLTLKHYLRLLSAENAAARAQGAAKEVSTNLQKEREQAVNFKKQASLERKRVQDLETKFLTHKNMAAEEIQKITVQLEEERKQRLEEVRKRQQLDEQKSEEVRKARAEAIERQKQAEEAARHQMATLNEQLAKEREQAQKERLEREKAEEVAQERLRKLRQECDEAQDREAAAARQRLQEATRQVEAEREERARKEHAAIAQEAALRKTIEETRIQLQEQQEKLLREQQLRSEAVEKVNKISRQLSVVRKKTAAERHAQAQKQKETQERLEKLQAQMQETNKQDEEKLTKLATNLTQLQSEAEQERLNRERVQREAAEKLAKLESERRAAEQRIKSEAEQKLKDVESRLQNYRERTTAQRRDLEQQQARTRTELARLDAERRKAEALGLVQQARVQEELEATKKRAEEEQKAREALDRKHAEERERLQRERQEAEDKLKSEASAKVQEVQSQLQEVQTRMQQEQKSRQEQQQQHEELVKKLEAEREEARKQGQSELQAAEHRLIEEKRKWQSEQKMQMSSLEGLKAQLIALGSAQEAAKANVADLNARLEQEKSLREKLDADLKIAQEKVRSEQVRVEEATEAKRQAEAAARDQLARLEAQMLSAKAQGKEELDQAHKQYEALVIRLRQEEEERERVSQEARQKLAELDKERLRCELNWKHGTEKLQAMESQLKAKQDLYDRERAERAAERSKMQTEYQKLLREKQAAEERGAHDVVAVKEQLQRSMEEAQQTQRFKEQHAQEQLASLRSEYEEERKRHVTTVTTIQEMRDRFDQDRETWSAKIETAKEQERATAERLRALEADLVLSKERSEQELAKSRREIQAEREKLASEKAAREFAQQQATSLLAEIQAEKHYAETQVKEMREQLEKERLEHGKLLEQAKQQHVETAKKNAELGSSLDAQRQDLERHRQQAERELLDAREALDSTEKKLRITMAELEEARKQQAAEATERLETLRQTYSQQIETHRVQITKITTEKTVQEKHWQQTIQQLEAKQRELLEAQEETAEKMDGLESELAEKDHELEVLRAEAGKVNALRAVMFGARWKGLLELKKMEQEREAAYQQQQQTARRLSEELSKVESYQQSLETVREEKASEIASLQTKLADVETKLGKRASLTKEQLQSLTEEQATLKSEHEKLTQTLDENKAEAEKWRNEAKTKEDELEAARRKHQEEMDKLRKQFANLQAINEANTADVMSSSSYSMNVSSSTELSSSSPAPPPNEPQPQQQQSTPSSTSGVSNTTDIHLHHHHYHHYQSEKTETVIKVSKTDEQRVMEHKYATESQENALGLGETSDSCFVCKQSTTGSATITAVGKVYHKDCFRCRDCQTNLHGTAFYEKEDSLYCFKCLYKNFGSHCQQCGLHIAPAYPGERGYMIKTSAFCCHKKCFQCAVCEREFVRKVEGRGAYPWRGRLYCRRHAHILSGRGDPGDL